MPLTLKGGIKLQMMADVVQNKVRMPANSDEYVASKKDFSFSNGDTSIKDSDFPRCIRGYAVFLKKKLAFTEK